MSFEKVAGQPHVIDSLKASIEKGRLGHALLFQGASSAAALETAAALAKHFFCENLRGPKACGACRQCRLVDQKTHPDFTLVSPLEDSQVIKIGQIREIIAQANLKPFEARSKLFVINPAAAMNEEAQNAFLKTLEEPQGHTRFILITQSAAGLLETIRSRCQAFYFAPSEEALPEGEDFSSLRLAVLEFLLSRNRRNAGIFPDLAKHERETIQRLLDSLLQYFRDVLLIQSGADQLISGEEDLVRKRRLASELDEEELQERIEFLSEIKEKVMNKVNLKLISWTLSESP